MSADLVAVGVGQADVDDLGARACTWARPISAASSNCSSTISSLNLREPMTLVRSPTITGRSSSVELERRRRR